ncbi:MAG: hypothetical protein AAFU85_33665, partial [Planctomycetota bacterium]
MPRRFFALAVLAVLTRAMPARAQFELNARTIDALPDDPAAEMVAGMHRFLDRKIESLGETRQTYWTDSASINSNRDSLIEQLGLEPTRCESDSVLNEYQPTTPSQPVSVARVRWPVLSHPAPQLSNTASLWGEGLFLKGPADRPLLILIPDASEAPEDYLRDDVLAYASAASVLIAETVGYDFHKHGSVELTRRDYLHRAAFELGRTLTGYEVQTVQAAIDRFATTETIVCGIGEGGRTALMAGSVDDRIDWTLVGGYFANRDGLANEPLNRQLFGFSRRFNDAHLAALICPRGLVVFDVGPYSVSVASRGAAPAKWKSPSLEESRAEIHASKRLAKRLSLDTSKSRVVSDLHSAIELTLGERFEKAENVKGSKPELQTRVRTRDERLFATVDAHNQAVLAESEYERARFLNLGHTRTSRETESNRLDTSSERAYRASIQRFRSLFEEQVIGRYDEEVLPMNARSVQTHRGDGWTSHGVILDVFPNVFAYGELLVPDGIDANEKRAVVVCQHGLEGRPQDTMLGDHRAYHDYAARLAQQGYLVFAPQNPYIGKDDFRSLQRKSYPLGKTLFSLIAAQHRQILRWLKTLPNVDPDRIAFYGLSYGG